VARTATAMQELCLSRSNAPEEKDPCHCLVPPCLQKQPSPAHFAQTTAGISILLLHLPAAADWAAGQKKHQAEFMFKQFSSLGLLNRFASCDNVQEVASHETYAKLPSKQVKYAKLANKHDAVWRYKLMCNRREQSTGLPEQNAGLWYLPVKVQCLQGLPRINSTHHTQQWFPHLAVCT